MYTTEPENYTIAEYFALEEKAVEKHEYINGKIVQMSGGTIYHGLIAANLITELNIALYPNEKKYFVMGSDIKISIPQKNQIRYPDAVVVCEKIERLPGRKDVLLNPLIVVEVLSDSTRRFDKTGKFDLYQRIPSLKEYILIEQESPEITGFFREEADLWRTQSITDLSENFKFRALNVEIGLEKIYRGVEFREEE